MNEDMNDDLAWGPCSPGTPIDWFQGRMRLSGLTRGVTDKCGIHLSREADSFKIPYHTIDAIPTLFVRQRNRQEQRVYEKAQSGAEFKGRYTQPKGSKNRVYWPPLYTQRTQYNDPSVPLIICEGELKAIRCKMACAESALDMLVCGVPGTELGEEVYADLNSILCTTTVADIKVHRTVFLALDWGGKGRGREASADLEYNLRELFQMLGAVVVTVRWGVEEGAGEQKLDEWLTAGGDLSAVLQEAYENKKAENSELQTMWDRLNRNYAIMHGHYVPLVDITRKYVSKHLDTMEADLRVPLSKSKILRASDIWDLQPLAERNVCHSYEFVPPPLGQDVERYVWVEGQRALNTAPEWGWEHSPIGYDKEPDIAPFMALLERLFQDHGDWYLDFLAQIAQQPAVRGHHIIILQDGGNTGKDRLFDTLDLVFGRYSGMVGTGLTSSFNSNLEHLLIAHWSDPVLSGKGGLDRILDSVLKNYSGTSRQEINHKGGAKYSVLNYGRLHIAHNQGWIVKIPERERRYGVFGGTDVMPHAWAKEYMDWVNKGGVEQIRRALVERDISNFDIFAPAPRTSKRVEMELASRTDLEEWLQEGVELADRDLWQVKDICALWGGLSGRTVSPEAMGVQIKKLPDSARFPPAKIAGTNTRFVALRNGAMWLERHAVEGNAMFSGLRAGGKIG